MTYKPSTAKQHEELAKQIFEKIGCHHKWQMKHIMYDTMWLSTVLNDFANKVYDQAVQDLGELRRGI